MLSTVSFANQATLLSKVKTVPPVNQVGAEHKAQNFLLSVYVGVMVFGGNVLNKLFASLCQIATKTDRTTSHFFFFK